MDPESSITLTKEVEEDATVEEVTVRIYRGAELALHIEPFVKRDGRRFGLVEFFGKEYIDGDGDFFEFKTSEGVEEADLVGVDVENTAPTGTEQNLTYDFAVDMTLDREGGTERATTSLFDQLRGWL